MPARTSVELGLGEQRELQRGQLEAGLDRAHQQVGDPGLRIRGELVDGPGRDLALGEHVGGALDEPVAAGRDRDSPAVAQQPGDVIGGALGLAGEARHRLRLEAQHVLLVDVEGAERPPGAGPGCGAQRRRP